MKGLAAVIYTETIQTLLMVIGGLTLMGFSFYEVGGYRGLYEKYMNLQPKAPINSTAYTCALPNPKAFQMLRGITDNDMPWLGFFLGQTPTSIWYWCTDQVIFLFRFRYLTK